MTTSPVNALRRTFNKVYKDKESPDDIWIVLVRVTAEDNNLYHSAESLAKAVEEEEPSRFRNEFLCEWEIPKRHFVHKVSARTLLERGMQRHLRLDEEGCRHLPPTKDLRHQIARDKLDPSNDGFGIGISLGHMAKCFGARAPVYDIAHDILADCSWILLLDHDLQTVRVSYWLGHEAHLDFEHFYWIENGIDTSIMEWWLQDTQFLLDYGDFREWASSLESEMEEQWEALFEARNLDDTSDCVMISRGLDERHQRLKERKDAMNAEIEAAALKLGL